MSIKNPSSALWPWRVISFLFWYGKEFIVANARVTADVLRPRKRMKMSPAIIAVPAASESDSEWSMISILITLTPGTMTLSISRQHRILYVHGMFAETRESLVEEIQEMEDRMLRAMRRSPGDLSRPQDGRLTPETLRASSGTTEDGDHQ